MSSTPDNILLRSRELWAQAFPEDKPEFLDLYFSRCYTAERNLTLTEENSDEIVAAGQILPLAFNFGGRRLSAGYVSGLVVDPASRGKGLGARWMAEAHRRMHAEGQVLSLLIPDGDELRNWYAQAPTALTTPFRTASPSPCSKRANPLAPACPTSPKSTS